MTEDENQRQGNYAQIAQVVKNATYSICKKKIKM